MQYEQVGYLHGAGQEMPYQIMHSVVRATLEEEREDNSVLALFSKGLSGTWASSTH